MSDLTDMVSHSAQVWSSLLTPGMSSMWGPQGPSQHSPKAADSIGRATFIRQEVRLGLAAMAVWSLFSSPLQLPRRRGRVWEGFATLIQL